MYHASVSSRLLAIVVLAVGLAAAIFWYTRRDHIQPLASTPYDAPLAGDASSTMQPAKSRVRRMTRAQRDELRTQIARAAEARVGDFEAQPSLVDPQPAHQSPDPAIRKFNDRALEELGGTQTYLAECYDQHRKALPANLTVFTRVRILTDPDVGAIVDADALTDPAGKPLPAEFDTCIRDMLQTFALPPLPPTEDAQFLLAFQLSFRDDDDTLEP